MTRLRFPPLALAAAILSMGAMFGASAQSAGAASATAGTSATKPAARALAGADRHFVEKAASDGMAEVELGQIAQQKASDDQVKQFAARMVQDHTKANDELKQIASGKGVQLPSGPDKKHASEARKMQEMSGADFDRQYAKHMLADHKAAVADFEKASKSGKDAEVKAFAEKTLPTLREHLKMAQALNDAGKGKAKKTGS
ncbi:MAG TPA: DUF4142 domain-containing protein [Albitalea sp.]|uniref:DUF4142 domain-containing protein n=1 Tax=Piscinibacter sp. TaxID=1903157 RepID=UPI002ED55B20